MSVIICFKYSYTYFEHEVLAMNTPELKYILSFLERFYNYSLLGTQHLLTND